VFVVAGAGNGFDPAEVLFEREGMRRDIAPSREARKEVTELVGTLAANGGGLTRPAGNANELDFCISTEVAKTLTCGAGQRYDSETDNFVVGALGARTGLSQGVQDASVGHMIVHGTQDPCVSDIAFAQGRNNGGENVLFQPIPDIVGALSCNSGPNGHDAGNFACNQAVDAGHVIVQPMYDPSPTLDASYSKGTGERNGIERNVVAQPYSIMPMNSGKDYKARETDVAQPLMTSQVGGNQGGDYVVQPIAYRVHGEHSTAMTGNGTANVADPVDITRAIDTNGGFATNQGGNIVVQPIAFNSKDYGSDATTDMSPTLRSLGAYDANGGGSMAVAQPMAFAQNTRDEVRYINGDGQIVGALAAESGMKQTNYIAQTMAYASSDGIVRPLGDVMSTLDAARESRGSAQQRFIHQQMAVRRLTPRECERLQGFPDDYTEIPKAADGPRYKALGNSMAVPVMRWIGQRVQKHILPSRSVI
jgi:hypothetical protein